MMNSTTGRGIMEIFTSRNSNGILLRRIVVATVLVPPVFCWIVFNGYRNGLYDLAAALSFFAAANMAAFASLIAISSLRRQNLDTTLKKSDTALHEAMVKAVEERAKSEAIIAAIGDGVSFQDTHLRVMYQNEIHRQMIGDHAGEICYQAYEQRDEICEGCPVVKSLEDGRIHHSTRAVEVNGEIRYYDITASPLLDANGKAVAGIEVVRDVTERLSIEKLKEEYVSMISHDLRTPLAVMLGQAQILDRAVALQDTDQILRSADLIHANGKRMNKMINDLVDSARLERPSLELQRSPVILEDLLSETINRAVSPSDQERVTLEIQDEIPPVEADRERLQRAVVNLLTNAFKFSAWDAPVSVSLAKRGSEAIVSISDRGIGIEPDELPHIFQRFYRAASGKQIEGLGLGLHIARLIVEAHGGRLWVKSTLGEGSVFHFSVPVAAGDDSFANSEGGLEAAATGPAAS